MVRANCQAPQPLSKMGDILPSHSILDLSTEYVFHYHKGLFGIHGSMGGAPGKFVGNSWVGYAIIFNLL